MAEKTKEPRELEVTVRVPIVGFEFDKKSGRKKTLEPGQDVTIPTATARRLEAAGRVAIDEDARKDAKAVARKAADPAKAAAKA